MLFYLVLITLLCVARQSEAFSPAHMGIRPHMYTQKKIGQTSLSMTSTTPKFGIGGFNAARESLLRSTDALKAVVNEASKPESRKRRRDMFKALLKQNWLVVGEVIVILIAKWWPQLMASGGILRAELLVGKVGVFVIFFLNGIALSIDTSADEVKTAAKTNALIQLWNMAFMPLCAYLLAGFYPDKQFYEGLLVLSVVPQTINISVAQTMAAGANMGTAIFNAIFGNLLGVLLTPLMAVLMVGAGQNVSLFHTLKKLGYLVVAPMVLGQLCRRTPLVDLAERFNKKSRTICSLILLGIVWNTFSDTFIRGMGISGAALGRLMVTMPIAYCVFCFLFWKTSKVALPGIDARTRAAALFCSSQKTLAFGIPFIKTAFGTRPDIAQILAPLLLYAPAELLIGSTILVPKMVDEIASEDSNLDGAGI